MQQLQPTRWPDVLFERDLSLPDELLESCRSVSVRLGGPRIELLGVSSAIHGEGRSTIATALTLIQAIDYCRPAMLVELDGRRPSLASRLGVDAQPGLSELAHGKRSLAEVIQPVGPRFSVITAGAALPDSEVVILDRLPDVIKDLQALSEVMVFDLPPVLTSSYGTRAASLCEQVVFVIRAGVTPQSRVREAIGFLSPAPSILLNGVQSPLPRWLRTMLAV